MTEQGKQKEPPFSMYICQKAPNFRFRIKDGATAEEEKWVQFENGSLKLTDPEEIKLLDGFLNRPHISALIQKVSWERAMAQAAKAAAEHGRKQRLANGTSNTSHQHEKQAIFDSYDETVLARAGIDPARFASVTKGMEEQGLVLTQKQDTSGAIAEDNARLAALQAQTGQSQIKLGS